MVGRGKGESRAEVLVKCLPKGTCKAGVTVGDNGLGESVALKDMKEKK
jgi:hypothetical protein